MKYGDTLRQRSVPQWAYQNVAYDSIKRLIKEHTTPGKGKAVAIPGHGERIDANFEHELFDILADQHSNVNLFVRSKSGEISRRLDHLARQLHNLQVTSWPPSVRPARIPPSRLAKYGRIEEQALQAGEEIKLLSRYISAQRTAFIKLLKKYKKWTGRTSLQERWNTDVVSGPDSFTKFDLGPFLNHWAELLQDIRFAMGTERIKSASTSLTQSPAIDPMTPKQSSVAVARRIHDTLSIGSDVDFDSVLATSPLGSDGARAAYWVHTEQLIELQVLLLQHSRLAFPKYPPYSANESPTSSGTRRSSISIGRRDSAIDKEPSAGMIVLDDENEFPLSQNSLPIGDAEDSHSIPPSEPAVSMRWAGGSDLVICLKSRDSVNTSETLEAPAKLKPKHLSAFLDVEEMFVPRLSTKGSETPGTKTPDSACASNNEMLLQARKWLLEHPQIQPLVAFTYRRLRFSCFPNGRDHGQWCTLDTDIRMKKVSSDDFEGKDWQQTFSNDSIQFPYAILKVRQEGKSNVDLIKLLDDSHLTERVRGFSLAAHALWTCCRPSSMTPPFWLPALSVDIRKLPLGKGSRHSRRPSTRPSSAMGTDDLASSSTAVSTAEMSNSSGRHIRATHNRSVRYAAGTRDRITKREMSQLQRKCYWSEYDNPEDSDSEDGYYLYINPEDDDSWIPFRDTATSIYSWFKHLFVKTKRLDTEDPESQTLLSTDRLAKGALYESAADEGTSTSSSDSEGSDADILRPYSTSYGTLPVSQPLAVHDRDRDRFGVLLASMISLFFSTTLSIVLLVLSAVGRKRARGEIDVVVLAGLFVSLAFAIGGLWGIFKHGAGILRYTIGITIFAVIVIADGLLVGKLIAELRHLP